MLRLSLTFDESGHVEFGRSVLERRAAADPMQKMAISLINALPVHWLGMVGVRPSDETLVFLSRLPTVLAALVLGALVFAWSTRLYGPLGGLLSTTLYALCPSVLAHSQLATNDLYAACLMLASTMLVVRYLESPTLSRALLCAAVTGVAQVTKQTALLLVPTFGVLWILAVARARWSRQALLRGLTHGALAVLVVLLVVNAAYLFRESFLPARVYLEAYREALPAARASSIIMALASLATLAPGLPVPLPSAYAHALLFGIHANALGLGHGPIYLLGQLDPMGWWYYFLVVLLLKTPLPVLILLVAAGALSDPWIRKRPLDEIALWLAPVVIFAFFSFACTAQLGIRYLLPMLPFLHVAIGKVAVHVPRHVLTPLYRVAVGLLVAWSAVSTLSFHPHYLSYFNELIGDRKNMYRYLADSNVDWGQNGHDLQRYLAANRDRPLAINPATPVDGRVIVNVNMLVGVLAPAEQFRWLRELEPVDHIGYGLLVYDVPRR
jgi:4-amino-4-deoxy-L-arabinose transferase-like glycosyltransferase